MAFLGLTAGEAALGAAGIQAGGSLLGGVLGASGAQAASAQQFQNQEMLFNQQQAENWAFYNDQKQQQNTAWQRGVADMKAAGLNPILAATMGPEGTVSPSITGTPNAPPVNNAGAMMGAGLANAANSAKTYYDVKNTMAQTDKTAADTDVAKATKANVDAQTSKTGQDERTSKATEDVNKATVAKVAADAVKSYAEASNASELARVNRRAADDAEKFGSSPFGQAIAGIGRVFHSIAGSGSNNSAATTNGQGTNSDSGPWPTITIGRRKWGTD